MYGAAAAVGFGAGELVRWHTERQRRLLRWGYPAAFLVFGIVISGVDAAQHRHPGLHRARGRAAGRGLATGPQIDADPSLPGVHQHGGNSGTISGMIGGPDITGSSL